MAILGIFGFSHGIVIDKTCKFELQQPTWDPQIHAVVMKVMKTAFLRLLPASLVSHQAQRKNAILRESLKTVPWMRYFSISTKFITNIKIAYQSDKLHC